jgi:hypothetical protein
MDGEGIDLPGHGKDPPHLPLRHGQHEITTHVACVPVRGPRQLCRWRR